MACVGDRRGAYRILVGIPEGKGSLGRPRHRWRVTLKIDLREVEWGGMDWIDLARGRVRWQKLVTVITVLQVSYSVGNSLTS